MSRIFLFTAGVLFGVLCGLFVQPAHSEAGSVPRAAADLSARADVIGLAFPKPQERITRPSPEPRTPAKRVIRTKARPAAPELNGSVGYAVASGNCVNEPGINNPGFGNPSDWPVTSQVPTIGATAVFTWNHVGVVTGIWKNGDVEVRHQNFWGGQHRFPRSTFRGFR